MKLPVSLHRVLRDLLADVALLKAGHRQAREQTHQELAELRGRILQLEAKQAEQAKQAKPTPSGDSPEEAKPSLRELREERGMWLEEVARGSCVRPELLEALERGETATELQRQAPEQVRSWLGQIATLHEIAQAIRLCRLEAGITRRGLANASGLDLPVIEDLERGKPVQGGLSGHKVSPRSMALEVLEVARRLGNGGRR